MAQTEPYIEKDISVPIEVTESEERRPRKVKWYRYG
jgi:hypothetical protein